MRIEAAVLREKRIDEDDLVIGLVAHHGHLLRPVLARLPRWVSGEPPRERTHPRNLNAAWASVQECPLNVSHLTLVTDRLFQLYDVLVDVTRKPAPT